MRRLHGGIWLSPDHTFTFGKEEAISSGWKHDADENQTNTFEFRIRFKLPLVSKLLELDRVAFNYFYKQVKRDYVKNVCSAEVKANNGKN